MKILSLYTHLKTQYIFNCRPSVPLHVNTMNDDCRFQAATIPRIFHNSGLENWAEVIWITFKLL